MIFRRVMLVVLPLLAMTFLFLLLRRLYLDYEAGRLEDTGTAAQADLGQPRGVEEMAMQKGGHKVSEDVNFIRMDEQRRVTSIFKAKRVVHYAKNTADITLPSIQYFTQPRKAGEQGAVITIVADEGTVVTTGSLANLDDIESGDLRGHVVLSHDNATPDDSTDDTLVGFEDLQFDNEAYTLSTDGVVVMAGLQMDLTARKMRMALDRKTRRITALTFLEDILITLESEKRLKMGLVPEPGEEPPAAAGTAPKTPAVAGAAAAPPTAVAGAAKPGGLGAAPPTEPPKTGKDLWRIDVGGDVDARQESQRIRCDHLKLYSETAGSLLRPGAPAETGEGAATETGLPRAASPTAAAGGAAGSRLGPDGRAVSDKPARPARAKAADAPFLKEGAPGPLVVMADGPLMMSPVDAAEQAAIGEERNEVAAEGKPVIVQDGQMTVRGELVRYNMARGTGIVDGREGVVQLDQPERMHLVGKRLEFDQRQATANVLGEGELHARVNTEGLTGVSSEPAKAPAEEPSTLDARWAKAMNLKFYRLPARQAGVEDAGVGEIQRAAFHGQAEVKQKDGVLRGDELVIDFFRAAPPRLRAGGQAVEHLVGHGDVFVRNDRPGAGASGGVGGVSVGDIACQDLDITFARNASGGTDPRRLKAVGKVAVNDPKGKIRAEDLAVTFGRTNEGKLDARFLEAFGDVLIDREDLHAEGSHVRRDLESGVLLLEGKPARAKRGESRVVGPYIEFREGEGVAIVRGAGELEAPATTDLRGQPRKKPEPLLVTWKNGMRFEDRRNFAQFEGGVTAETGGSRLAAQKMWVHFLDRPEAPAKPAPGKANAAASDGLDNLFGRKALDRLYAQDDVHTMDRQLAPDGTVRHQMEMVGDNLTYLAEDRKAYMRGPGRLRLLAREKPGRGEREPPAIAPADVAGAWQGAVPPGYARTDIAWDDSMAYEGASMRAYFKGGVDAKHVGRGVPGEQGRARTRPTDSRIRSADLQVVFGERKADGGTPKAVPTPAAPEESMTIDKLIADGGVLLWVDDRRGSGRRLIYSRDPEIVRLFRGPDAYAMLWQENEAKQQYGQIEAGTITFIPSTGKVEVKDQKEIIIGQ